MVPLWRAPSSTHTASKAPPRWGGTALAAAAFGGGSVPLTSDEGHWADGTMSTVFGYGGVGEANLDPTLATGAFKPFTDLDVAGLDDIGWDIDYKAVIPEPASGALMLLAAFLFSNRRRR